MALDGWEPFLGAFGKHRRLADASGRSLLRASLRTGDDLFRRIERAKQEWEATADAIPDLICMVDGNGRIVRVNRAVETWGLTSVTEAPGLSLHDVVHPECESPSCYLSLLIKRLPDVIFRGERPRVEVYDRHLKRHIQATVYPLPASARTKNVHTTAAVIFLKDVSEQKAAEESLRRYTTRFEILHDLGRAILAARSPRAIAQEALRRLRRLVECERASVVLLNERSNTYLILAVDVDGETALAEGREFPVNSPAIRGVSEEMVVVGDLDALPQRTPLEESLRREGIRSFVNVPLRVDGRVIGSLNLGSRQPYGFDDEDLGVAEEVAHLVAIAVRQAQLMDQLWETNRALEMALKAKEEMILYVSHELLTPLTVIEGYRALLAEEMFGPLSPEQKEVLTTMEAQARRLMAQIQRLLMLQRVEAEAPVQEPVDLAALVGWVAATWCARARERGLTLAAEYPDARVLVYGDADLLQQMMEELLDNALKFGAEGREVRVRLWQEKSEARLSVQDEGVGIPAEVLPHLFQHFLQVNGGLNRVVGGMGIGLALCRKVVEAHGGRIWVESAGKGHGATFHVALPLMNAASSTATTD